MRFHLVNLPFTSTTHEYSSCAFTEKVRKFSDMMFDLGHEVILYGGPENIARCTEHVQCVSREAQDKHLNGDHYCRASYDYALPFWRSYNARVAAEIITRKQPQDFICVIAGLASKEIADMVPDLRTVEFGIGYGGTFAKHRVWESYAWMHTCYGSAADHPNAADGIWYDEVIPGYFEVDLFEYSAEKDDYFFFIGRLDDRKGFQIAADVCKKIDKKLLIAGQGAPPDYGEYLGVIGPEERNKIMSRARAVFVPTIYIEPFGNVAVEAQACGTPVISTDWGAMTETVIHGVTGFRCRMFRDFVEATKKVETLDPATIRKHAMDNYSMPVIAKKYHTYFDRLLTLDGEGWYS